MRRCGMIQDCPSNTTCSPRGVGFPLSLGSKDMERRGAGRNNACPSLILGGPSSHTQDLGDEADGNGHICRTGHGTVTESRMWILILNRASGRPAAFLYVHKRQVAQHAVGHNRVIDHASPCHRSRRETCVGFRTSSDTEFRRTAVLVLRGRVLATAIRLL